MGDARAGGPEGGEPDPEAAPSEVSPSETPPSETLPSEVAPDDVAAAVDAVVDGAHDGVRGSTVRRRAEAPAATPTPLVPPIWAGRGGGTAGPSGAAGVPPRARPGVAVPSGGYVRFSDHRRRPGLAWAVAVVVAVAVLAAVAVIALL